MFKIGDAVTCDGKSMTLHGFSAIAVEQVPHAQRAWFGAVCVDLSGHAVGTYPLDEIAPATLSAVDIAAAPEIPSAPEAPIGASLDDE